MKTLKMSLVNAQGKLSRKEMKTIMAGSGEWPWTRCPCAFSEQCYVFDCNGGGFVTCHNGICVH